MYLNESLVQLADSLYLQRTFDPNSKHGNTEISKYNRIIGKMKKLSSYLSILGLEYLSERK